MAAALSIARGRGPARHPQPLADTDRKVIRRPSSVRPVRQILTCLLQAFKRADLEEPLMDFVGGEPAAFGQ